MHIFIDLSKVSDTIDHSILTKILELYRVKQNNLMWFASDFSNYKQYISYNNNKWKYSIQPLKV